MQEGTEVALAASSAMPVTWGDGGGDGEGDVGDPHWVWYRSCVRDGGMPW